MTKEKWKIENDRDAEWIIEQIEEDLIETNRFKESLQSKIEDLQDKLKKVEEEEKQAKERRDNYLIEYFETIPDELKKKTKTQEKYRLPSGEIIKKYPNPQYKRDNTKLLDWIKDNEMTDFVQVNESPKWGELKKVTETVNGQVVTKDGEIVEGIEVIERPPTLEFKEV